MQEAYAKTTCIAGKARILVASALIFSFSKIWEWRANETKTTREKERASWKGNRKKGGVCEYLLDQVTSDGITVFKIDCVLLRI